MSGRPLSSEVLGALRFSRFWITCFKNPKSINPDRNDQIKTLIFTVAILIIETNNKDVALFITINTAGEPFNGRPRRYANSHESDFVISLINISANTALKDTLGRKWHKANKTTEWYGCTEYKDKTGKQYRHLHLHSIIYGDKVPALIENSFVEKFDRSLRFHHRQRTMIDAYDVNINYVPYSEAYKTFNYILKNYETSPRAREFQRVF